MILPLRLHCRSSLSLSLNLSLSLTPSLSSLKHSPQTAPHNNQPKKHASLDLLPSPPPLDPSTSTSPHCRSLQPRKFVEAPVLFISIERKGPNVILIIISLPDPLEPRTVCTKDSQCTPLKCKNGVCQCKLNPQAKGKERLGSAGVR